MSSIHQENRLNYIQELFESNPDLFDHQLIPTLKAAGAKRVTATLPLNNHPIHGETVLFINETLESDGKLYEYRYGWERSTRLKRMGKATRSIAAFDKQEHPEPPFNHIETDPYHHHHVPGDLLPRVETNIKNLDDVITFLKDYILSGKKYKSSDRF